MLREKRFLFNCFATKQSMFRYAKIVRLASVTPTLASSGSKWLSQALAGSLWLFLAVSLPLSGSLWLPLWLPLALISTLWLTLALSDSLLFSNFAYTVLDQLSGPLLGSQRRCHADALSPALFICILFSQYKIFWVLQNSKHRLLSWDKMYFPGFFSPGEMAAITIRGCRAVNPPRLPLAT